MGEVVLQGGVGFCNAVRRTLISDLSMWAPCEVTFRTNTSCQTDEFIAHRVGLIPFVRVGNGDTLELQATGPGVGSCMVTTKDVRGPAFQPVHDTIEIMQLGPGQELDLTIHFDQQQASKHARYSPCAAVGMSKVDNDGRYKISFQTVNGKNPKDVILTALDLLEKRVDRALIGIAKQPACPPKSMC